MYNNINYQNIKVKECCDILNIKFAKLQLLLKNKDTLEQLKEYLDDSKTYFQTMEIAVYLYILQRLLTEDDEEESILGKILRKTGLLIVSSDIVV